MLCYMWGIHISSYFDIDREGINKWKRSLTDSEIASNYKHDMCWNPYSYNLVKSQRCQNVCCVCVTLLDILFHFIFISYCFYSQTPSVVFLATIFPFMVVGNGVVLTLILRKRGPKTRMDILFANTACAGTHIKSINDYMCYKIMSVQNSPFKLSDVGLDTRHHWVDGDKCILLAIYIVISFKNWSHPILKHTHTLLSAPT